MVARGQLPWVAVFLLLLVAQALAEPLPSWNPGPARTSILNFVDQVESDKIPLEERVAAFDNDGTLWCELPVNPQFLFSLELLRRRVATHPEWRTTQPFRAGLEGDEATLAAVGTPGRVKLGLGAAAGLTTQEYHQAVVDFLTTAKHPRFQRPYTECVYQPMLELMAFLREHGFTIYLVSGASQDFMRPWSQEVYAIPPERVLGTTSVLKYDANGPKLILQPETDFHDERENKPVAIHRAAGRRPLACFGNSDGDLQMLQWATRFALLVHHTDADREYSYDRASTFGRLDKALEEARARGWTVVDMKTDWKTILPRQ